MSTFFTILLIGTTCGVGMGVVAYCVCAIFEVDA